MIISVSRRCDIPRFAFGWFMERLEAGFAEVTNPFNSRQKRRVSLLPPAPERAPEESAELFAFWTRDPAAILEHADELKKRGFAFYVMTTLTAYPAVLEANAPPAGTVIQTLGRLAEKISPERVIWRYDPVFLSEQTGFDFHRRNFAELSSRLAGITRRVIVSVYDEYAGAERRLLESEKRGLLKRLPHYAPAPAGGKRTLLPAVRGLLAELASIAAAKGMEIQSCAEEDLSDCGISPGACVDGEYIAKTFGIKTPGRDRSQRPGCLCARSADIGFYGRCPAGCLYCYGLR